MVYREFIGRDQKPMYLASLGGLEGGSISPGGAATLLGVTRQYVNELVYQHPRVRAWVYREAVGETARYIDVCLADLVRYGVKNGRFRLGDDLPYVGELCERDLTLDPLTE